MNTLEITVKFGERKTSDSGEVTWPKVNAVKSAIITCHEIPQKEAVWQLLNMLGDMELDRSVQYIPCNP